MIPLPCSFERCLVLQEIGGLPSKQGDVRYPQFDDFDFRIRYRRSFLRFRSNCNRPDLVGFPITFASTTPGGQTPSTLTGASRPSILNSPCLGVFGISINNCPPPLWGPAAADRSILKKSPPVIFRCQTPSIPTRLMVLPFPLIDSSAFPNGNQLWGLWDKHPLIGWSMCFFSKVASTRQLRCPTLHIQA